MLSFKNKNVLFIEFYIYNENFPVVILFSNSNVLFEFSIATLRGTLELSYSFISDLGIHLKSKRDLIK